MVAFEVLAVGFIMKLVGIFFVICALALVLIILIQKGKGGGLSAALAGGMASGILGSKTGDFLTWVTIVLVGIFLTLAVVMAKFYRPVVGGSDEITQTQPAQTQTIPAQRPEAVGEPKPPPLEQAVPEAGRDIDVNTTGD